MTLFFCIFILTPPPPFLVFPPLPMLFSRTPNRPATYPQWYAYHRLGTTTTYATKYIFVFPHRKHRFHRIFRCSVRACCGYVMANDSLHSNGHVYSYLALVVKGANRLTDTHTTQCKGKAVCRHFYVTLKLRETLIGPHKVIHFPLSHACFVSPSAIYLSSSRMSRAVYLVGYCCCSASDTCPDSRVGG
jgi:hypothetical protein